MSEYENVCGVVWCAVCASANNVVNVAYWKNAMQPHRTNYSRPELHANLMELFQDLQHLKPHHTILVRNTKLSTGITINILKRIRSGVYFECLFRVHFGFNLVHPMPLGVKIVQAFLVRFNEVTNIVERSDLECEQNVFSVILQHQF